MPKFKGKARRSRSPSGPRDGGSTGGYSGCDALLVPRIAEYARSNDLGDIDDVVEHLRGCYREYQRKPMAIFRKGVERAVEEVIKRGPVSKPSLTIDAMEHAHLERKGLKVAGEVEESDDDSDDDSDDSDSEDQPSDSDEIDPRVEEGPPVDIDGDDEGRVMNDELARLYNGNNTNERNAQSDTPQPSSAFAPPHVVAAAAQRALEAAGNNGSTGTTGKQSVSKIQEKHPPMSAAEAGHVAAMAVARANRIKQIENSRSGGRQGKQARREAKGRAKKGLSNKSEFGQIDFVEDYLPGGGKYKKGGVGNGPGDPFGLEGNDGDSNGFTPSKPRDVSLLDLGGIEESLRAIRELILCPLTHPELYDWLGVDPPRGVLLHGPPGCGKTTLAHAIANEAGVPFFSIAAPEIVAGVSGESEHKIRQLFTAAAAAAPSIIFIDEVDAIVPKRDGAQRQMESRIVAQLLASMDTLNDGEGTNRFVEGEGGEDGDGHDDDMNEGQYGGAPPPPRQKHVTVIGATNRVDAIDAALRRAGRFDREIMLGIPDEAARGRILEVQAKRLRLVGGLDLKNIAKKTPGYVGADLSALAKEAAALAVSRIFDTLAGETPTLGEVTGDKKSSTSDDPSERKQSNLLGGRLADRTPLHAPELTGLAITNEDFAEALTRVQPSAQREGFTTTPEVTWDDVGSLTEVREELNFSIVEPIAHPERFHAMGLAASTGVLLYGPPGCGKTLVAKATANEAQANFISIKGPELLNKYVGESERAVRTLFARARAASPCVLFFDELDSLAPRRGGEGNQASERVVNQLLTEMDGLESRTATFVVAATNRPDMIDPAMLRPGRLDKLLYVPLPPPDGRLSILSTLTRKTPLDKSVNISEVAYSSRCNGFSGADLASLVREACVAALKGNIKNFAREDLDKTLTKTPPQVTIKHFEEAFQRVQPSVSSADQKRYDELRRKLRKERGSIRGKGEEKKDLSEKSGDGMMTLDPGPGEEMEISGGAGGSGGSGGRRTSASGSKKRKA